MKKIFIILSILIMFIGCNVSAKQASIGSLIPVDEHASLHGEKFLYSDFYYNNNVIEANSLKDNYIIFAGIKNLGDEDLPVSITVGLFNSEKKNIGVVYYCSTKDNITASSNAIVKVGEEIPAVVQIKEGNLVEGNTMSDVKYISVLDENIECKKGFRNQFAGKNVDEIDLNETEKVTESSSFKGFGLAFGLLFGIVIAGTVLKLLVFGKPKSRNKLRDEMIKNHNNNVTNNINNGTNTTNNDMSNNFINNVDNGSVLNNLPSNNENVVTSIIPDFEKNPDAKVNPVPTTTFETIPQTIPQTTPPTEPSGDSDLLNMFK